VTIATILSLGETALKLGLESEILAFPDSATAEEVRAAVARLNADPPERRGMRRSSPQARALALHAGQPRAPPLAGLLALRVRVGAVHYA